MEKATGSMLVVLVIGALIGAGATYYYVQPQIKSAFSQGAAYQQSIDTQGVTGTSPDLAVTFDTATFDLSAALDADGNVIADPSLAVTHTITITNNGDTDANAVWISLYNPVKDKYGLDKDFQTDYTNVYIAAGSLSKISLYKDGAFTSGYEIGTIPAGADVTIDFTFELVKNNKGLFPVGTDTDMMVYVYGAGAASAETLDYTVTT